MSSPADERVDLEVVAVRAETPAVRSLTLRRADGEPLPPFGPGDHLKLWPSGLGDHRCYSLIATEPDPEGWRAPRAYRIAVRLDEAGRGGSRALHALVPGDRLAASPPISGFPLAEGTGPVLLVAGGIGVTPLLSIAAALRAAGRPFRAVYAVRTRAELAFADELRALAGPDNFAVHCDDEAGRVLDVAAVLAGAGEAAVYLCGPSPMIEAARAEARRLGWPEERLRFELFSAAPAAGDRAFEVELRSSGRVIPVPADRTILDALLEAGEDPLHDCRRGDCGICQCAVLEGEPDHRDFVLSEAERASGALIQICVSRSRSPRLVLDL